MSGLWACCDCLCPPTGALRRHMVAQRSSTRSGRGVDNAGYQPDLLFTAPTTVQRQPDQDGSNQETSTPSSPQISQDEACVAGHYNSMPCEFCPASPSEHCDLEGQHTCSPEDHVQNSLSRQLSECHQLEDIKEADDETMDSTVQNAADKYVVATDAANTAAKYIVVTDSATPSTHDGDQVSRASPKKRRASMFHRKSQPTVSANQEPRHESRWRRRFSRYPHNTDEFSADLSSIAGQDSVEQQPKRTRRFSLWRSPDSGSEPPVGETEFGGYRQRRASHAGLRDIFRRRGSRHESEPRQSSCDENEDDTASIEFELAAAAAALKRWRRVTTTEFDNDAPLATHCDFLDSVQDAFAKVDAKVYAEHKQHQPDVSSSSSEEEVPDSLEAQLMLRLAESKHIHPDKVEKREERRHSLPLGSSASKAETSKTDFSRQPRRHSVASASYISYHISSPSEQTNQIPQQSLASSYSPRDTDAGSIRSDCSHAENSDRFDSPGAKAEGDNTSVSSSERRPPASRRSRPSIFNRLFSHGGAQRRGSLSSTETFSPKVATPEVRHSSWFHQAPESEMEQVEAPTPQMFRQRRATVAELSLQSFLDEVDVKTKALREEEFQGPDPYEVLAPTQIQEDDDHIIPIVDTNRCVKLMLEDAEKKLETEYIHAHCSPDPHLAPSPTDVLQSFSMSKTAEQDKSIDTAIRGPSKAEQMERALVPYQTAVPHQLGKFSSLNFIVMMAFADRGDFNGGIDNPGGLTPDPSLHTLASWSESVPNAADQNDTEQTNTPAANASHTSQTAIRSSQSSTSSHVSEHDSSPFGQPVEANSQGMNSLRNPTSKKMLSRVSARPSSSAGPSKNRSRSSSRDEPRPSSVSSRKLKKRASIRRSSRNITPDTSANAVASQHSRVSFQKISSTEISHTNEPTPSGSVTAPNNSSMQKPITTESAVRSRKSVLSQKQSQKPVSSTYVRKSRKSLVKEVHQKESAQHTEAWGGPIHSASDAKPVPSTSVSKSTSSNISTGRLTCKTFKGNSEHKSTTDESTPMAHKSVKISKHKRSRSKTDDQESDTFSAQSTVLAVYSPISSQTDMSGISQQATSDMDTKQSNVQPGESENIDERVATLTDILRDDFTASEETKTVIREGSVADELPEEPMEVTDDNSGNEYQDKDKTKSDEEIHQECVTDNMTIEPELSDKEGLLANMDTNSHEQIENEDANAMAKSTTKAEENKGIETDKGKETDDEGIEKTDTSKSMELSRQISKQIVEAELKEQKSTNSGKETAVHSSKESEENIFQGNADSTTYTDNPNESINQSRPYVGTREEAIKDTGTKRHIHHTYTSADIEIDRLSQPELDPVLHNQENTVPKTELFKTSAAEPNSELDLQDDDNERIERYMTEKDTKKTQQRDIRAQDNTNTVSGMISQEKQTAAEETKTDVYEIKDRDDNMHAEQSNTTKSDSDISQSQHSSEESMQTDTSVSEALEASMVSANNIEANHEANTTSTASVTKVTSDGMPPAPKSDSSATYRESRKSIQPSLKHNSSIASSPALNKRLLTQNHSPHQYLDSEDTASKRSQYEIPEPEKTVGHLPQDEYEPAESKHYINNSFEVESKSLGSISDNVAQPEHKMSKEVANQVSKSARHTIQDCHALSEDDAAKDDTPIMDSNSPTVSPHESEIAHQDSNNDALISPKTSSHISQGIGQPSHHALHRRSQSARNTSSRLSEQGSVQNVPHQGSHVSQKSFQQISQRAFEVSERLYKNTPRRGSHALHQSAHEVSQHWSRASSLGSQGSRHGSQLSMNSPSGSTISRRRESQHGSRVSHKHSSASKHDSQLSRGSYHVPQTTSHEKQGNTHDHQGESRSSHNKIAQNRSHVVSLKSRSKLKPNVNIHHEISLNALRSQSVAQNASQASITVQTQETVAENLEISGAASYRISQQSTETRQRASQISNQTSHTESQISPYTSDSGSQISQHAISEYQSLASQQNSQPDLEMSLLSAVSDQSSHFSNASDRDDTHSNSHCGMLASERSAAPLSASISTISERKRNSKLYTASQTSFIKKIQSTQLSDTSTTDQKLAQPVSSKYVLASNSARHTHSFGTSSESTASPSPEPTAPIAQFTKTKRGSLATQQTQVGTIPLQASMLNQSCQTSVHAYETQLISDDPTTLVISTKNGPPVLDLKCRVCQSSLLNKTISNVEASEAKHVRPVKVADMTTQTSPEAFGSREITSSSVSVDHDRDGNAGTAGPSASQRPCPSPLSDFCQDVRHQDDSGPPQKTSVTASTQCPADEAEMAPQAFFRGCSGSAVLSTGEARSQLRQASTGSLSQHVQTSLEALKPAVDNHSVQTLIGNNTQSVETQFGGNPTHSLSSSVYEDITPPNSQHVQTANPQMTSQLPSAAEPDLRLPTDRETAPSASDASSQTARPTGPSVGTNTHDTAGLEEMEGAAETAGGVGWQVLVSDSRRCLDDRGSACGVQRRVEPPTAVALQLQLERQQQAAADRRQQLLQQRSSRAAQLADGPRHCSREQVHTEHPAPSTGAATRSEDDGEIDSATYPLDDAGTKSATLPADDVENKSATLPVDDAENKSAILAAGSAATKSSTLLVEDAETTSAARSVGEAETDVAAQSVAEAEANLTGVRSADDAAANSAVQSVAEAEASIVDGLIAESAVQSADDAAANSTVQSEVGAENSTAQSVTEAENNSAAQSVAEAEINSAVLSVAEAETNSATQSVFEPENSAVQSVTEAETNSAVQSVDDVEAQQSSQDTDEARRRNKKRELRNKREQQLARWRELTSDEDEEAAARASSRPRRTGRPRPKSSGARLKR